ncbi:MAG: Gfo/Idh/MocA family oxidoreductase [Armatimonadetes bacterium]|nr:Gfo/Idh/MocA family oxidoreductase [Armatimonadota bacterium]
MSDNLRVLVLGCGSIGERHICCLTQMGGVEVIACDTRAERLAAMSEQYGVSETVSSYDEVDLSDVLAVMICTPSDQHIGPATRAAEAGCHLFVEPPLAFSMDGVDALINLCRQRELVFQVGYFMRHHPNLKEIKALIEIGKIGKVNTVQLKTSHFIGKCWSGSPEVFWADAATGGGVIRDASQGLDLIQWLVGAVSQVAAMRARFMPDVDPDVEDAAALILRFANGALGTAILSRWRQNFKSGLELDGTLGSIEWAYESGEVRLYTEEDKSWRTHQVEVEQDDLFIAQARNFVAACRGEQTPAATGMDGKRALMAALAAQEAAESGGLVEIPCCCMCGD